MSTQPQHLSAARALAAALLVATCAGAPAAAAAARPGVPKPRAADPCRVAEPARPPLTSAARGVNAPVSSGHLRGYGHPQVDIRRSVLDLDWDGTTLRGTADLRLATTSNVTSVPLDLASRLAVRSASVDGRSVPVSRTATGLVLRTGTLRAGSEHAVRITYSGRPAGVTVRLGRDSEPLGWVRRVDGSVSTFAEPVGASTWMPTNELPSDKAIYSATVRTRAPYTAVFNGVRCGQTTRAGRTTSTWHASAPMPAYLVTLSVGRYSRYAVALTKGRTAWLYLRPEDLGQRARLVRDIRYAVDRLEARLGPYPFPSLGVVVTGGDSAMETQTMISLSAGSYTTSRDTIVHELAHQWFGDLVTTATWKDLWLNEGFAQYLQMQEKTMPWYDDASTNALMCAMTAEADGQAGNVRSGHLLGDGPYICGAMALAELRQQAGAQRFWAALKGWPQSRRYGTATRADFATYWRTATGKDPRPILAKWLDRANERMTTTAKVKG